jgi:hypothetical protein
MNLYLFTFLFAPVTSFQPPIAQSPAAHGTKKLFWTGLEPSRKSRRIRELMMSSKYDNVGVEDGTTTTSAVESMKKELIKLGVKTKRGFQASNREKKRARELVFELAKFNPTEDAASPYYEHPNETNPPLYSVEGNWTLLFTDAPDITTLDRNLLAELGRIGQECRRPYIKNVIEWKRPQWAAALPFSGSEESRVIQKVITKAKSDKSRPMLVDLRLAGLEVTTPGYETIKNNDIPNSIQQNGLIAGIIQASPLSWIGPVDAPFGEFEILYLDEGMRVTKTGQNHIAVNRRIKPGEEWF